MASVKALNCAMRTPNEYGRGAVCSHRAVEQGADCTFHRSAGATSSRCREDVQAGFEGGVEVEIESFVFGEAAMGDFEDVNFVVAFEVDDACVVFVQEVIGHHKAAVVLAQHKVMRSGVGAEADGGDLFQIEAVGGVEHDDLPGHKGTDDEPVAGLRGGHDLAHAAGYRGVNVRLDVERSKAGTPVPRSGSIR